ncbi:MAG: hypothetical protein R2856_11440 [Caldilineaceae bacterium]
MDGASRAPILLDHAAAVAANDCGGAGLPHTGRAARLDLFNVLFGRQQLSMATYNYETLNNNQHKTAAPSAISIILFC